MLWFNRFFWGLFLGFGGNIWKGIKVKLIYYSFIIKKDMCVVNVFLFVILNYFGF